MPRIEYTKKDDFLKWIKGEVDSNKYKAHVTEKMEVILAPRKSTRPITFGYFKASHTDNAKNTEALTAILAVLKAAGIAIYRCGNYEWKTENPVGSVYSEE